MKKRLEISKIKNTILMILVSFLILSIVCLAMWGKIQEIIDKQLENHVAEQSEMAADIINNFFNGELYLLKESTVFIDLDTGNLGTDFGEEEGVSYGVLRVNGEAVVGERLSFSEYSGIFEALHGNPSVCCGKDETILFTVPVYRGENVKYVLYKLYDSAVLAGQMDISLFEGSSEWVIVDVDGTIVLQAANGAYQTDVWTMAQNPEAIEDIKKRMNIRLSAAARSKSETDDNVVFSGDRFYRFVCNGIRADRCCFR